MRLSALLIAVVATDLCSAGCHGSPPSAPRSQPATAAQPYTPHANPSEPSSNPAAPTKAVTPHAKPKSSTSRQDIAQLDLNNEGGVRGGSYAMWVHVVRQGKPLKDIDVVALNDAHQAVASGHTNEDGDAMLRVDPATYKIAASFGHSHTEQTITFHPGDQFELDLQP